MDIEIGINRTPSQNYFISVGLNEKEAISFDNTTKGFRVIKQVLINKLKTPLDKLSDAISGEWYDIILKDGKFVRKNFVLWQDKDKIDIVNDEIWETVWEKPITKDTHETLVFYSQLISDNYEKLDQFIKQMADFETFIAKEIHKYQ